MKNSTVHTSLLFRVTGLKTLSKRTFCRKMHLWPSLKLRDSFKENYLKKLEWNFRRMNVEEQRQKLKNQSNSNQNQQKLLETDQADRAYGGIGLICREILMVLSCCYCCFCCGACIDEEESSN